MSNSPILALTTEAVGAAENYLSKNDKVMRGLIDKHAPCVLPKRRTSYFETLAWSVIGQQLSLKAAMTITSRVSQIVPSAFESRNFLSISPEQLRLAGLSKRKATCLIDLAHRIEDGQLSFASLRKMDNETVVAELTEVSGIGRWTAEMFLIFGLGRPDVLSLGDAGLQRSVRLLYGDSTLLGVVSENWSPWRSVASWYLWRHLDS